MHFCDAFFPSSREKYFSETERLFYDTIAGGNKKIRFTAESAHVFLEYNKDVVGVVVCTVGTSHERYNESNSILQFALKLFARTNQSCYLFLFLTFTVINDCSLPIHNRSFATACFNNN